MGFGMRFFAAFCGALLALTTPLSAQDRPRSCELMEGEAAEMMRILTPQRAEAVRAALVRRGLAFGFAEDNPTCLDAWADIRVIAAPENGGPMARPSRTCLRVEIVVADIALLAPGGRTEAITAIQQAAGMSGPGTVPTEASCEAAITPLRNLRRDLQGLAPLPIAEAEPTDPMQEPTPPPTSLQFALHRVPADGYVPLRTGPGKETARIGGLPGDARDITLGPAGCAPALVPETLAAESPRAQDRRLAQHWCDIRWQDKQGWVWGRYLTLR